MPRKPRLCYEITNITRQWPIKIEQRGRDKFRVSYGMQVSDNLTYEQACSNFGAYVFHALACEGSLDNSTGRN